MYGMYWSYITVFIVIAFSYRKVNAALCTNLSIENCNTFLSGANVSISDIIPDVPTWNENLLALNNRCKATHLYTSCMQEYLTNCSFEVKTFTNMVEQAYENMLCYAPENKIEFIEYRPCYSQLISTDFNKCKLIFNTSISSVSFDAKGLVKTEDTEEFCDAYAKYGKCLKYMVEMSVYPCGTNASLWLDVWYKKMKKPYLDSNGCNPDHPDTEDSWSLVLGIIIAITALILIVTATIFLGYIFTRRKNLTDTGERRRNRDSNSREAPPPYAMVGVADQGDELRLVDSESLQPTTLFNGAMPQNGLIMPPAYTNLGASDSMESVHKDIVEGNDKEAPQNGNLEIPACIEDIQAGERNLEIPELKENSVDLEIPVSTENRYSNNGNVCELTENGHSNDGELEIPESLESETDLGNGVYRSDNMEASEHDKNLE